MYPADAVLRSQLSSGLRFRLPGATFATESISPLQGFMRRCHYTGALPQATLFRSFGACEETTLAARALPPLPDSTPYVLEALTSA